MPKRVLGDRRNRSNLEGPERFGLVHQSEAIRSYSSPEHQDKLRHEARLVELRAMPHGVAFEAALMARGCKYIKWSGYEVSEGVGNLVELTATLSDAWNAPSDQSPHGESAQGLRVQDEHDRRGSRKGWIRSLNREPLRPIRA